MAGSPRRRRIARLSLREALLASPAYAYAALVHAVLLLVLSFIGVARYLEEPPREFEVSLANLAEVTVEEPLRHDEPRDLAEAPPLPDAVDVGALGEATLGDAPGTVDAPRAPRVQGLAGIGGRRGGSGGLSRNPGGGTRTSYAARDAGLEWLAGHRNAAGLWSTSPVHPGSGDDADVALAHSSLALLAFLAAGHSPRAPGPYQELLAHAAAALVEPRQRAQLEVDRYAFYARPIYLMALAELRKADPENEALAEVAQAQVRYLTRIRGRRGWRYTPDSYFGDTSVNAWVGLSLKAAESAGATVPPKNYAVLRRHLRDVTGEDGRTGYVYRGRRANHAMNASGLFLRIMLGEDPGRERNRNAVRLLTRDEQGLREGFYSLYYQSLALHQVGGEGWRWFNPRARELLIRTQVGAGCERGSWACTSHWVSSRVVATSLAVLTLEVYDRYVPGRPQHAEQGQRGVESEAWDRLSAAVRAAEAKVVTALKAEPGGALLAAEAEVCEVLEQVSASSLEASDRDALAGACHQSLIELALRQDDPDVLAARVDACLEAFPDARTDDLLRLQRYARRMRLHRQATALIEAGRAADPQAVQGRLAELGQLHAADPADPYAAQLAAALIFDAGDPAEAGRAAERWVTRHDPRAERPADAVERRWLASLAEGALASLQRAAADGDEAARAEGERLRGLLRQRRIPARAAELAQQAQPLLAAIERLRPHALLAGGQLRAAAELARAQGLEDLERSALLRLLHREGALEGDARARAIALLSQEAADAEEGLARATVLTTLDPQAGQEALARLADADDPQLQLRARVAAARLAREAGDDERARELLAACPADRYLVRLERARLAAKTDRRAAVEAYQSLLRALDDHPERWWTVAEEFAWAYVGWGERETAFEFVDGLRKRDPTFGGDDPRRRRLIDLLSELM